MNRVDRNGQILKEALAQPEPQPLSRLRLEQAQRKFRKINRKYERDVARFKRP